MNEEVQFYLEEAKERMDAALNHLEVELSKIRAGRANPKILQDVMVEYYGSPTPLSQVANISAPDPRTIAVQPWEKNMISPIEKAIMNANLGLNPDNNGEIIRINIPALTEERRRELVKQVKAMGEEAKIAIRNIRHDANEDIEKEEISEDEQKGLTNDVQELVNKYNKLVEEKTKEKEEELMTV